MCRDPKYSPDAYFALAWDSFKDELWIVIDRSPQFYHYQDEKFGRDEDGLRAPCHGAIGSRDITLARLHSMVLSSQTGKALMNEVLLHPDACRDLRLDEVAVYPNLATLPFYRHRNGALAGLGASQSEERVQIAKL